MYTNEYYRSQYSSNLETLSSILQNTDHTLINTVPAPGKWCIGEIVDHLIITGIKYAVVLEEKLSGDLALLKKGAGPYSHPFLMRQFIKIVSPEYQRNMPTIKPFEPHDHKNFEKESLLKQFEMLNNRFLKLIDLADKHQLDLGKIKVGNPIYPIWKMPISGCLALNEAHQRRHFGQIERILESAASD
ncbi:MAG: DinB family protein [Balneolaceae bacterium]